MATDTLVLVGANVEKQERRNPRGVYQKFPGKDSPWWIRYTDAQGRYRREIAGSKSAAIDLYRKRKNEAREGKKLPETLRQRPATYAEIAKDAREYIARRHKRPQSGLAQLARTVEWFGRYEAASITPAMIEAKLTAAADSEQWAASTYNHHLTAISMVFRRALRNEKVSTNPARGGGLRGDEKRKRSAGLYYRRPIYSFG